MKVELSIREESRFENNVRIGTALTCHENGQIETKTLLEQGEVITVEEFDSEERPVKIKARFSEMLRMGRLKNPAAESSLY